MQQHFIKFFSPGTFVSETTLIPVNKRCVHEAIEISKTIIERHNAKPYAFCFIIKARSGDELDSKVINSSGTYYLGGRSLTLDQVKKEMPDEKILISNMECNNWNEIIINDNSWRTIQPLRDGDVILSLNTGE